jgi:hypothetical protein
VKRKNPAGGGVFTDRPGFAGLGDKSLGKLGEDTSTDSACQGLRHFHLRKDGEMRRIASVPVTPEVAAIIKRLLGEGVYQHQIAGALGLNQGRVSEVKTGKRHPKIPPATQLPFDF